jgi:hypothetical protein
MNHSLLSLPVSKSLIYIVSSFSFVTHLFQTIAPLLITFIRWNLGCKRTDFYRGLLGSTVGTHDALSSTYHILIMYRNCEIIRVRLILLAQNLICMLGWVWPKAQKVAVITLTENLFCVVLRYRFRICLTRPLTTKNGHGYENRIQNGVKSILLSRMRM